MGRKAKYLTESAKKKAKREKRTVGLQKSIYLGIVFCVRHQKAELGFKMFIISHIAVACQEEILTVVVYTI